MVHFKFMTMPCVKYTFDISVVTHSTTISGHILFWYHSVIAQFSLISFLLIPE